MKLIGRVEPVLHLQGYLNTVPGGVYAPEDETNVTYIVRDKTGEEVPSELVEEESTAATKIIQLLVAIGGSTTDEELAEIEAEVDRLLNETDPVELGNLAGHSIVNKIRLAQTYRDDVISAIEEKGISAADEQPFRTVADLVKQIIRQAKTVTPTTEEQIIVPDEGVYGLESVTVEGVQLQEINVWSTDTEQVITPDEGYMGFSKIIVDAVDISGGDGGDYPGGGGGGDYPSYDDIPNADDSDFGYEYVEEEVTSNLYHYIRTGGSFSAPAPPSHPYLIICRASVVDGELVHGFIHGSDWPFYYYQYGYIVNVGDGVTDRLIYSYEFDGQSGGTDWVSTGTTVKIHNSPYWSNHDIYGWDDQDNYSLYHEKDSGPVPDLETVITQKPVEHQETYKISGNNVNSLVGAAQKVTGSQEPLTPSEATAALDDYMANPAEEMKW